MDGFSHGALIDLPRRRFCELRPDSPAYTAGGGTIVQRATHAMVELYQSIQQLKLDVGLHVAMHGTVGTMDEFVKILKAGKPGADDY